MSSSQVKADEDLLTKLHRITKLTMTEQKQNLDQIFKEKRIQML